MDYKSGGLFWLGCIPEMWLQVRLSDPQHTQLENGYKNDAVQSSGDSQGLWTIKFIYTYETYFYNLINNYTVIIDDDDDIF